MSIKVENLSFGYIKRPLSVVDVTFSLDDGEVLLLCGGDMAGKSSLLSVLSGLEKQYYGKIFYDEKELSEISESDKNISFITSRPVFFENKSIEYNLKYQLKVNNIFMTDEELNDVLKMFNFDFSLKTKVKKLNFEDKQILALIRSFLKKPKYLFIDDIFYKIKDNKEIVNKIKNAILAYLDCKKWVKTVILTDKFGIFADFTFKVLYLSYGKMTALKSLNDLKNNLIDLYSLAYFPHFEYDFYFAFDGESYYLLKYEEIKNKKGKIIEFKENARYKLFEILNEKLSKTKLAPNQEMLVVISSFKQIDFEKLSEEEISELMKNEKINMFEKNTCVKIV